MHGQAAAIILALNMVGRPNVMHPGKITHTTTCKVQQKYKPNSTRKEREKEMERDLRFKSLTVLSPNAVKSNTITC